MAAQCGESTRAGGQRGSEVPDLARTGAFTLNEMKKPLRVVENDLMAEGLDVDWRGQQ